jgi:hypothetical protein
MPRWPIIRIIGQRGGRVAKRGKSVESSGMRQISPPTNSDDDPDRHIRCQEALLSAFQDFLEAATEAGWNEREVAVAMIDLADHHILGMVEMEKTSAIVALIKRIT